jgi:hypothetical protein
MVSGRALLLSGILTLAVSTFLLAPPAQATTVCSITSVALIVSGAGQTPTINPCSGMASGSNSGTGDSGSASITLGDGSTHSTLQGTNNVTAGTKGTVTTNVTAALPGQFVFGASGSSAKIGNVQYDLTTTQLVEFDTATVSLTNVNQVNLAHAFFTITNSFQDIFTANFGIKSNVTALTSANYTDGNGVSPIRQLRYSCGLHQLFCRSRRYSNV